jgi:hypothetical protein
MAFLGAVVVLLGLVAPSAALRVAAIRSAVSTRVISTIRMADQNFDFGEPRSAVPSSTTEVLRPLLLPSSCVWAWQTPLREHPLLPALPMRGGMRDAPKCCSHTHGALAAWPIR